VTAGLQKVFSADPAVGFLSHAARFADAAATGKILAPAKSLGEMSRIAFNDYVDATLAALFAAIVVAMVAYGVLACIRAMRNPRSTALEIGAMMAAGDD
jgi:carbon starvation protein